MSKATQLINLEKIDGERRVSSRDIVDHTGVTYKATNNLIRKHKARLETFGSLPFKKAAKSKTGQEKHALLNEDQAIFLITLSRNTEKVVDFKQALVAAFSKLRRKQARIDENRAKSDFHQNRTFGVYERHNMTDVIQEFINYAIARGSKNAGNYYRVITMCIQKAMDVPKRDDVDATTLHLLASGEVVAEVALRTAMHDELPYKEVFQFMKQAVLNFRRTTIYTGEPE